MIYEHGVNKFVFLSNKITVCDKSWEPNRVVIPQTWQQKKSRIKYFYSDRLRGQTLRRQIRKKFFGQPRFRRISLPKNLSKQYFKSAGNRNICKGEGGHKDLQK